MVKYVDDPLRIIKTNKLAGRKYPTCSYSLTRESQISIRKISFGKDLRTLIAIRRSRVLPPHYYTPDRNNAPADFRFFTKIPLGLSQGSVISIRPDDSCKSSVTGGIQLFSIQISSGIIEAEASPSH